ncbi:unnamed protein product [Nippostrongylus brasiliensis]|uniref:ANK_REP_REGION domain-containing protein n=1 Tax=Nippostrongylus brasiliensis TaxID=27835 RepID=A0A0N4Y429_NIPBR|nr:unnamed protein product [Nippostrongylus brasiliensis]
MDDSETSVTDLSVSPESVAIAVGGCGIGGVQICPAIMLGSSQALPAVAKHIYSRLAANAAEVDEGMPNLIVSLVSNGNQLSDKYLSRFQSALTPLITGGNLWLISSGEHHDPLARTASGALRSVLPQDSCELCAVLHSAYLLFRSSQFEHTKFVSWLEEQLDAVSIENVRSATETVVRIFATAFGDTQLVEFLDCDELPSLAPKLIELCLQCHSGSTEARQLLQLAAHINEPSILNEVDLDDLLDDELMTTILCETVAVEDRVAFLAAILERKPQISISSEMLLKMARRASDQKRLSFGVDFLIPPTTLNGDFMQHRDPADSIRVLALLFKIWALLLHCPSLVRCLCAFSDQPVAFSLVLSRLAKSLARESHDWFFYEESLLRLGDALSDSAVALVTKVHKTSPNKAYRLLCQPIEGFHGATLSQLAFQFNNRSLISHESCQRWLHRLLYGQLQTCSSTILPRWLKTLIAASSNKSTSSSIAFALLFYTDRQILVVAALQAASHSSSGLFCGLLSFILLPGCGNLTLDAVVWMWTFIAWIEAVWVLNMRSHVTPLSLMPWRLFGPIVVRVKIMILRDFTNFLILVALVMSRDAEDAPTRNPAAEYKRVLSQAIDKRNCANFSSAAAIHAVLYPDRDISISVARSLLSWVWLSLFTTDLSSIKESDACRKTFLGTPASYCGAVGEYGNSSCPSQSAAGYLVVLEYFVLLKLILWPILFAFFSKTAKNVDEEADKIWKYQMYALVTEFSLRPPLPPPLTPLFFFCVACCRTGGQLGGMMSNFPDHPDVDLRDKSRSTVRFGSVYRNPSVPAKKNEFVNSFWRQLMIDRWQEETQTRSEQSGNADIKTVQKQLRMLTLNSTYTGSERRKKSEMELVPYAETDVKRLAVPSSERPWQILIPRYSPPFYCRPAEEFSADVAKHVEVATEQNVAELRRIWRSRQALDGGKGWRLSACGYPLNPHGRRGIAGRGCHPRFGANKRCYYIILTGTTKAECKLLLDSSHSLPNEPHPESGSKDEHLASLLRTVGLPESDAQLFSMRRLDSSVIDSCETVPPTDTSPVHIDRLAVEHDIDTDHAWTEHDIWAISLRKRIVLQAMIGYRWHPLSSSTSLLLNVHAELLNKTLRVYGII